MTSGHHDIYLCLLHEPYDTPAAPVPINATIVHSETLLHPDLQQPDAGRMYRCLVEVPRPAGAVVPLSTLTFELAGGELWPEVADWETVADGIVKLSRQQACDAMPLGLPNDQTILLANGPTTVLHRRRSDGEVEEVALSERAAIIANLEGHVANFVATGPFWPGHGLITPPAEPARMPYSPYQPGTPEVGVRRDQEASAQPKAKRRFWRR